MKMETELRLSIARCEICYAGFRAAFHDTLNCLLRQYVDPSDDAGRRCGFLDGIAMLASTAPQVQLECLFRTWQHVVDPRTTFPTPLDHCVLYAALDSLAGAAISGDQRLLQLVWQGPRQIVTPADCWLPARVRCLQALHQWLLPGGLDDIRPARDFRPDRNSKPDRDTRPARDVGPAQGSQLGAGAEGEHSIRHQKPTGRRGLDRRQDRDELLDTVGRWTVDEAILVASEGLLNKNEVVVIRTFFQEHPRLLTRT